MQPLVEYLEVGHLCVALLRASMIRQLNVPEAGQLVHQNRVLLYEGIEDVLHHTTRHRVIFSSLIFCHVYCIKTKSVIVSLT